jgi:hypothetical protein
LTQVICIIKNDPQGSNSGYGRVVRGGGWSGTDVNYCRVALRRRDEPGFGYGSVGFRLVLLQVSFSLVLFEGIQMIMQMEESSPVLVILKEIQKYSILCKASNENERVA